MEVVSFDSARGHWNVTYGANVTLGSNGTLTLPNPATAGSPGVFFGNNPPTDGNIFFRLWNAIVLISDFDGAAPLPLQEGILLQFDVAAGTNYVAGDYWTFSVRAGEITNVTPLIDDKPPEGIHYHRVPLGIIEWIPASLPARPSEIEDCRRIFQPLTRLATCCTFRVGDGMSSHGDFTTIQAAVNALPAAGGEVCVLPGEYRESVLISRRRDITIKGCGPRTRVIAPSGAAPVFRILESQNIQILSLAAEAHHTNVGILLEGRAKETILRTGPDAPLLNITLENLLIRAATRSAIEARIGYNVTVRRCRIEMRDIATGWPGLFFIGEDSLIEENVIVVENAEDRVRGIEWTNPLDPIRRRAPVLRGAVCSWAAAVSASASSTMSSRAVSRPASSSGACKQSRSLRVFRSPVHRRARSISADHAGRGISRSHRVMAAPRTTRTSSEGDLYEILIERNRIFNMGMNGIGEVGFFEPGHVNDFVSVHGLVITGNVIRRCMRREVVIPPPMLKKIGYGGIALSHVEYPRHSRQHDRDNGPNQLEPVCGDFHSLR